MSGGSVAASAARERAADVAPMATGAFGNALLVAQTLDSSLPLGANLYPDNFFAQIRKLSTALAAQHKLAGGKNGRLDIELIRKQGYGLRNNEDGTQSVTFNFLYKTEKRKFGDQYIPMDEFLRRMNDSVSPFFNRVDVKINGAEGAVYGRVWVNGGPPRP